MEAGWLETSKKRERERERGQEEGGERARETETAPPRRAYPVLIRTNHPLSPRLNLLDRGSRIKSIDLRAPSWPVEPHEPRGLNPP